MRVRLYTSRRRRKQARTRQWILLAGSVCVLFLCMLGLGRYVLDDVRSDRIGQTFQEIYYEKEDLQADRDSPALRGPILRQFEVTFSSPAAENTAVAAPPKIIGWPGNPSMTVSVRLQKLQKQNKDIIGWLSIPDMLEQAVVQRNNTYYLNLDSLGYHNANGALFLEEGISLTTRPDTYIIFGHNMKTGEMFGSLRLYTDVGYYRRHPVIDFSVLYEEGRYKTPKEIIDMLVDVVAKNGCVLLNILQRPDGTIDKEAEFILDEMAKWYEINGEAIYASQPWKTVGEGDTVLEFKDYHEDAAAWKNDDIRYVCRDNIVYAFLWGPKGTQPPFCAISMKAKM